MACAAALHTTTLPLAWGQGGSTAAGNARNRTLFVESVAPTRTIRESCFFMADRHPQTVAPSEQNNSMLPAARGLNRVEAARYVGVSPVTFDKLVTEGTMPRPLKVFARRIWDRRRLDLAMDALVQDNDDEPNPWDNA